MERELKRKRLKKEEKKAKNRNKPERKKREYSREHLVWQFHHRNDKKVAQKIREGDVDLITGTGWGFFDKFFAFLFALGFFSVVSIEGNGYQRKMLSIVMLLTTYSTKILFGISSMNQVPHLLFREIGLLKMIGFTATQIEKGICKRGKGKSVPMHKNTLADMLGRLTQKEIEGIVNGMVKLLVKKGFIHEDIFILDSTDLPTTRKYEGAGRKTVCEKKFDRRTHQEVEIPVTKYGFKLIMIQEVKSKIIVAAVVAKINEHESQYTLRLLSQAQKNLGEKKIRVLLIDNGFMDGVTLWKIKKEYEIDFITRVRTNMNIANDIRGFRYTPPDNLVKKEERGKGKDKMSIVGVGGLTTYDQYGDEEHKKRKTKKNFKGNPINAIMVTKWKGKEYEEGEEPIFTTSLPVDNPFEIIDTYDLRSLIENVGFRELKQGWLIGKFPVKTEVGVRSHTLLTLMMYSLTAAFQTKLGRQIAEKGIRRLRTEDMQTIHKMIIFAGEYFGIFDVEEYALIVRSPPKFFVRTNPTATKRRLGLKE